MRSAFSTITVFIAATFALAAEMPRESGERMSLGATEPDLVRVVLQPVLRDSGKIVSGTVLQVEHRNSDSSSALAITRIVFRVDEAVRNVRHGQTVEINEWAGLWQSGERYHPGERVLLFLYPPSKLGLTSPVGNHAGRFAVNRAGQVTLKGTIGKPPRAIEIRRVVVAIRQAEKE